MNVKEIQPLSEREEVSVDIDDLERVRDEFTAESASDAIEEIDKIDITLDSDDAEEVAEAKPEKKNLSEGLKKTRLGFFQKIHSIFSGKSELDASAIEELEALLVSCDIGVETTKQLIALVQERVDNAGASKIISVSLQEAYEQVA